MTLMSLSMDEKQQRCLDYQVVAVRTFRGKDDCFASHGIFNL